MRHISNIAGVALCNALAIQGASAALFPDLHKNTDFDRAISISTESVADQVEYSPNLDDGGFLAPEKRSRYQAARFEYSQQTDSRSVLKVSLAQREMTSLRDSYDVSQLELKGIHRISKPSATYFFDLALSASFNHTDRLHKNSYTTYDGNLITRSSIDNPQDQSLDISIIGGLKLGHGFSVRALSGGGFTRTDHRSVNGVGRSADGCQYAFSTDGKGGSLNQLGTCGDVISYQQTFADEEGVGERLGFRASKDIAYLASFIQMGSEIGWSTQRFTASLGYRYRRYFRGELDQNIEDEGRTAVRVSQLLDAQLTYSPSAKWRLSFSATYHSAPFLDDIPFLYTAFTSERYHDADALSFRLGGSWYFGE
ncbi:MAG: hypothetical protein AB8B79_05605 [Granulosicoccus sp.]